MVCRLSSMVPDGCNGRNGHCNGWIPLALGLLLFTDPIVVLLFMFNTKNTVQRPTFNSSSAGGGAARGVV